MPLELLVTAPREIGYGEYTDAELKGNQVLVETTVSGIKHGTVYGETCPFGYNVVKDGVHVRDFHATLLHLLGIDHEQLTFKFQGLDAKLTGVEPARVVHEIIG